MASHNPTPHPDAHGAPCQLKYPSVRADGRERYTATEYWHFVGIVLR